MAESKDFGGLATLYVGDLHPDVTEPILQEKFQPYGSVAIVHVCRDSVTRKSLGYAYVNFYSRADAQQALDKLNYTPIKGRCCRIMWNNRDKRLSPNDAANIFIKNLEPSVDSRTLYDTFNMFGAIVSCKVASDIHGMSRGYGFVQYESEDAAKQAIERVNGREIAGRKIFVGPVIKRDRGEAVTTHCSLYIRNIPGEMDDEQVVELFKTCGDVASYLVLNDGRSGKRYAFINYPDEEAASKAIDTLHGKDMRTDEEKAEGLKEKEAKSEKDEKEAAGEEEKDEEKDEAKEAGGEAAPSSPKKDDDGDDDDEAEAKDEDAGEGKDRRLPSYCLSVVLAKSKAERDADTRRKVVEPKAVEREGIKLYVRNLPAETTDESLKKLFIPYGTVTDIKAVMDRESGQCKGYGFVRFSTMDEATAAVAATHLKEAIPGHSPLNVGLASAKGNHKGEGKGKGEGGGGKFGFGKGKGKGGKNMPPMPSMPGMPPMQGMMFPMQWMAPPGGQMPQRPMYPGMPPMGIFGNPLAMVRPGMPPVPRPGPAPAPPAPITAATLAAMPPHSRKQMLGERLYQQVSKIEPRLAGKITGMFLEMKEPELLILLESAQMLREKVVEATRILENAASTSH